MRIAEPQHAELKRVIDLERYTSEQRIKAFLKVKQTFVEHGHGPQTEESLREADAADAQWRAAKSRIELITQEICTGKRIVIDER